MGLDILPLPGSDVLNPNTGVPVTVLDQIQQNLSIPGILSNDWTDPNYVPPDRTDAAATEITNASVLDTFAGFAAKIGTTVSNVLNAQKYGYQLTPQAGAAQEQGTIARPLTSGFAGLSWPLVLILAVLAYLLFGKRR